MLIPKFPLIVGVVFEHFEAFVDLLLNSAQPGKKNNIVLSTQVRVGPVQIYRPISAITNAAYTGLFPER